MRPFLNLQLWYLLVGNKIESVTYTRIIKGGNRFEMILLLHDYRLHAMRQYFCLKEHNFFSKFINRIK